MFGGKNYQTHALRLRNIIHTKGFKQTAWALSGNIGYALMQWLMLIILVRMMSPATVGQYALAFALCAPVIMFSNMRLRLLLAADSQDDFSFSNYMKARLVSSALAFAFIAIISFIILGYGQQFIVIFLVALAKAIESVSDIYYALFQKHKVIFYMAASLLIKGILSLILFFLALYYSKDIIYACLTLPLSWLAILLFYDRPTALKLLDQSKKDPSGLRNAPIEKHAEDNSRYITLIRTAIILAPTALVGSLFVNVTRYMIGATLGDVQLGIYAAIAYIGVAGQLVAASLVQPIMPSLASSFREGKKADFFKYYKYLLAVALILTVGSAGFAILFGELFLSIIYGKLYADHSDIFLLAMISASFSYFVLYQWYIFTAMKQLNSQLALSVLTLLILSIFSLIWTPIYGIDGAIYAEILAFSTHGLLGLWFVNKIVQDRWPKIEDNNSHSHG